MISQSSLCTEPLIYFQQCWGSELSYVNIMEECPKWDVLPGPAAYHSCFASHRVFSLRMVSSLWYSCVWPFHSQEWSIWKFPLQPHQKYYITQMKNLAFHSLLRWKMIMLPILAISLIPFSLKGWDSVTFWSWEWKGWNLTKHWAWLSAFGKYYVNKLFSIADLRLYRETRGKKGSRGR